VTKSRRSRQNRQNPQVREFILRNVRDHPDSIVALAVKKFGLTRTTINRYVVRLQEEGLLTGRGKTRARRYGLATLVSETFAIEISAGLAEHHVWRFRVLPFLEDLPKNVLGVCRYGFTEMLNNVIDHSASAKCSIFIRRNYADVGILIRDYGIGIFKKIQRDFGLEDARDALLELSKGKLTSDKARHSGEGIYFTSRMFDRFQLASGDLFYDRNRREDDNWLIETGDRGAPAAGTRVYLGISTNIDWSAEDVFEKYTGNKAGFRRTHVPVKLGLYQDDELVSRSQAKRILARSENFSEVLLDFDGVQYIGQPFADEIFRVFKLDHPDIAVRAVRANSKIIKMIDYVKAAGELAGGQPDRH
jgi:anti-sigma regulatory factor (Ser/Thr protein kinase)